MGLEEIRKLKNEFKLIYNNRCGWWGQWYKLTKLGKTIPLT